MQNGKSALQLAVFDGHDLASAELLKAEGGYSDVSVHYWKRLVFPFPFAGTDSC